MGQFEEILLNKVDFGRYELLVKLPQFLRFQPHFWIFFITNIKIKLRKVILKSEDAQIMFILLVASEFEEAATVERAIGDQKYFAW